MNDYERREKLLRNLHTAEDAAQNFCTPIYAVDDRGGPYLLGSGVLLDVADATYLATAAHVLDRNSDSNLYLPGNPLVSLRAVPRRRELRLASEMTTPSIWEWSSSTKPFSIPSYK